MNFGVLGFLIRMLDPVAFFRALGQGMNELVRKVPLAWSLALRDVHSRHRSQFLGPL